MRRLDVGTAHLEAVLIDHFLARFVALGARGDTGGEIMAVNVGMGMGFHAASLSFPLLPGIGGSSGLRTGQVPR